MMRYDVNDNRSVMLLDVLGSTRATMTNAVRLFIMTMLTKRLNYGVIEIEFCYYISFIRNV